MKTLKLLGILLSLLLITAGCSEAIKGQYITVQKVIDDDNYEDFNKVTNKKQVLKAREILDNADWVVEKEDMAGSADYQFQFPFKSDGDNKIMSYYLWISEDGGTVEVTTDSKDYVHLSAEYSSILLEILTE